MEMLSATELYKTESIQIVIQSFEHAVEGS